MKKVIILAAGKPHYGSNPSIFFKQNKYFNNFDVLKNILSEYSNNITLITGFKHKSLKKKIKANTIHNKEWKNTKSFSSLLLADFEKTNEIIVVYSDIIFNPKVVGSAWMPWLLPIHIVYLCFKACFFIEVNS